MPTAEFKAKVGLEAIRGQKTINEICSGPRSQDRNAPSLSCAFDFIRSWTALPYRWDFMPSQALKIQYDDIGDRSKFLFTGNARLLSASWNIVF